MSVHVKLHILY